MNAPRPALSFRAVLRGLRRHNPRIGITKECSVRGRLPAKLIGQSGWSFAGLFAVMPPSFLELFPVLATEVAMLHPQKP